MIIDISLIRLLIIHKKKKNQNFIYQTIRSFIYQSFILFDYIFDFELVYKSSHKGKKIKIVEKSLLKNFIFHLFFCFFISFQLTVSSKNFNNK